MKVYDMISTVLFFVWASACIMYSLYALWRTLVYAPWDVSTLLKAPVPRGVLLKQICTGMQDEEDILDPAMQKALLQEQRADWLFQLQKWSRVPRVCSRLSTAMTFLVAIPFVCRGLSEILRTEQKLSSTFAAQVLNLFAVGLCGTVWCMQIQTSMLRILAKERNSLESLFAQRDR